MEICVFERIGNDAHLEGIFRRSAHGEAHAVHRDAAFVNREIPALCHSRVIFIGEGEGSASVHVFHLGADGSLVNMTLHDVSVQTTVQKHGTLDVDFIAHLQSSEVAALQRFFHSRDGVGATTCSDHRQTHAVVGDALINFQLGNETARKRDVYIGLMLLKRNHFCCFFYDS